MILLSIVPPFPLSTSTSDSRAQLAIDGITGCYVIIGDEQPHPT